MAHINITKRWMVWPAVMTVSALVAACPSQIAQGPQPALVECPHTWDFPGRTGAELSTVGRLTNVPEFHDCQRLLLEKDSTTYGPLAAVFRSDTLDAFPVDTSDILPQSAVTVAEIYMVEGGGYQPLELGPNFNCLYLFGKTYSLTARVVHVGQNESLCLRKLGDVPANEQKPLTVRMEKVNGVEGFTRADIPVVARWNWEPGTRRHFISLACGDYWCHVGPYQTSFLNAQLHRYSIASAEPRELRRTVRIGGWHDEQLLALYNTGGGAYPSATRGTAYPDSQLGTYQETSFDTTWQPVAYVALTTTLPVYTTKYAWAVAPAPPPANLNKVYFCRGSRSGCRIPAGAALKCPNAPDAWWAQSLPPNAALNGGASKYLCVHMRPSPPGFTIPAVVRWRWRANDETLWVRCPVGCCEVDDPPQ